MDQVLTTRQLRSRGMTERAIERSVRNGDLVRLRRGLYASRAADPAIAAASRFGALTCVSALQHYKVWTMPDRRLHVRVPADSTVRSGTVVVHRHGRASHRGIDSPPDALEQLCRCADDLGILVAVDSALNRKLVSPHEIEQLLGSTIRRRRILSRVSASAESGIETIARVRLRACGVRLRTQVVIAGVGRVDILIGDRLVVELDGRTWHDTESTFESDRLRDAALVVRGYVVLRYTYTRVMDDWDSVQREVLSLVRRRRHVARGGQGWRPSA